MYYDTRARGRAELRRYLDFDVYARRRRDRGVLVSFCLDGYTPSLYFWMGLDGIVFILGYLMSLSVSQSSGNGGVPEQGEPP